MSGVCPQCGGYESDYGGCRNCAAASAADFAHDQALRDAARSSRASGALRSALELPLLFHGGSPWDDAKRARWKAITGSDEATTRVMCDHIRKVLDYTR